MEFRRVLFRSDDIVSSMTLAGDLGLDSLMAMELTVALEAQLGRALDPEELNRVETVEDVVRLVGSGRAMQPSTAIERVEAAPIDIPEPIAGAAKQLLTRAQMGFYNRVMKPTVYGRAFIPHNRNTIVVSNHTSHPDMGFV